ncbi:MAG: hypothetical protein IPL39_21035 [Opitutaceae bacterium]|nr:hypothetical protein [Opitutaceae bacterium]
MNNAFDHESMRHLLEDAGEGTRAAFEAQLAADPAAEAEFKATTDALAAFALEVAPEVAIKPGESARLAARITAMPCFAHTREKENRPRRRLWAKVAWPIAASLLLGLNLWQYSQLRLASAIGGTPVSQMEIPRAGTSPITEDPKSDSRLATPARAPALAASSTTVRSEATIPTEDHGDDQPGTTKAAAQELAKSGDESALANDKVVGALQRGRLVGLEMVDPGSYERGERRGLSALLQSLEPPAFGAPTTVPDGMSITPIGAITMPTGSGSNGPVVPYAWSMFDVEAGAGLVNLYNLPTVPTDQHLALWVKPSNGGIYSLVGEIPSILQGRSGSVLITFDPHIVVPGEVLITIEKRDGVASLPGPSASQQATLTSASVDATSAVISVSGSLGQQPFSANSSAGVPLGATLQPGPTVVLRGP